MTRLALSAVHAAPKLLRVANRSAIGTGAAPESRGDSRLRGSVMSGGGGPRSTGAAETTLDSQIASAAPASAILRQSLVMIGCSFVVALRSCRRRSGLSFAAGYGSRPGGRAQRDPQAGD